MKMPTIVGIFIFIGRENFMLSRVEHEKSFITSGPDEATALLYLHDEALCDRDMRNGLLGVTANSKDPDQTAEIYSLIKNFSIMFYITQWFY